MGVVVSPQNYSDILHSTGNVQRNLKDKLFGLGKSPHVPIWWDGKHINSWEPKVYLPSEAGAKWET